MTAARVLSISSNVRSLAWYRHGQWRAAEPFTVRSLNPSWTRNPLAGTVLPHERGRERERKRTRCSDLSFDLRGGSLPDAPLSPIGVRSLNPDGPNSALLGNLSRTLPKREPCGGYAKCFGQRFEHVHAGLRALLDVGDGGSAEIKQSSKCNLGKSSLDTNRG